VEFRWLSVPVESMAHNDWSWPSSAIAVGVVARCVYDNGWPVTVFRLASAPADEPATQTRSAAAAIAVGWPPTWKVCL
jgi:hypothetical protein